MKRLLALLISLTMMLVLLAPCSFAAGTASITINKSNVSSDWTDMTVNAYKVFTQANDGAATGKELYKVEDAFKDFFHVGTANNNFADGIGQYFGQPDGTTPDTLKPVYLWYDSAAGKLNAGNAAPTGQDYIQLDDPSALDKTYAEADLLGRIQQDKDGSGALLNKANNGQIATFYTWLEKYIENHPVNTATETHEILENEKTSITFSDLDSGYYALTFAEVPTGISVIQGILVKTVKDANTTMDLKAETLPLTKQVKNTGHDKENYADSTTVSVNDTVDYKITSQVPQVLDAENLTNFTLEDTMEKQKMIPGTVTLTLSKANATPTSATFTATVTGNAETVNLVDGSSNVIAQLTVEAYNTTTKEQKFTIDFLKPVDVNGQKNDLWKTYEGYTITLTYQAKVTADAVRVNQNTVKLWINDWQNPLEDFAKIYTYGLEVTKTFSSSDKPYDEVKFELHKDNGGVQGDVIGLVKTAADAKGSYRLPADNETGSTDPLTLSDSGTLTITGLDVGYYWLVEKESPDGYTPSDPIKIHLVAQKTPDPSLLDGQATTAIAIPEGKDEADGTTIQVAIKNPKDTTADTSTFSLAAFEVYNQKGFELPQTGSDGIWMFTIGGIVLIAVAGLLFAASRKKKNSD